MCCAALASQTGGSITRPASFCGVCGLKPTYGRVSVHGAIPVAFSLDHVGAIARSVSDLGIILAATAGHDPHDALSSAAAVPRGLASIVPALQPPSFNFGRGGLQTDAQPAASTAMDRAMALFKAAGASVRADFEFDLPLVVKMHRRIMAVEAAQYHREQYAARKSEYGRNIAALLEEGLALPAIDYAEARRFQLELRHWATIELAAGEFLLTPATVGPAPGADTTGDPRFNSPWSFIGFPTVNIPCGLSPEGLPIGLQIVGRPWEEDKLLSAAAWCERVLGFSAVPGMVRD
jgi:aspartyl-tRNA(Asn)/glutamyl-tRNA(Gln) amidotransferase subunit A